MAVSVTDSFSREDEKKAINVDVIELNESLLRYRKKEEAFSKKAHLLQKIDQLIVLDALNSDQERLQRTQQFLTTLDAITAAIKDYVSVTLENVLLSSQTRVTN